ncbi:MAG: histidinol-phosphate transaminase [Oscillatoria sp. PMC 1051.18]|nr:histidinol-phosphate transaminase [Oscillatoria sp. PMC 1050.18]MEC5030450.1 histidinol-phosphate transaminase [Oscillatoria sp. PMC 1051.18]
MFDFIRSDLAQFTAYTPHPGGKVTAPIDRLDTNESPYDLPIELKQKLAEIYQQNILTNRYPDGSHEKIKQVLAEYVNESANLPQIITSDRLSIGNGSDELIRSILIATCLRGEGSILVANPTFSMYEIIAQTLGIPVVTVGRSETNFAIDLAAAQASLQQTNNPPIRVVFVVHPNSPTANALTEAELDWLRNLPAQILVVIDEAYFEFSQTSVVGELEKHPNWIILRTFSKAFRLAAHRVGYAIANPELIAILEKIRLPYNLPAFSQAAALLTLEKRQLILPAIAKILSERDRLSQALSQNPIFKVWHSDANFIYLRLKNTTTDPHEELKQLTNTLKAQGTLIRHTGGGLRITVGTPEENTRTIQRLLGTGDW